MNKCFYALFIIAFCLGCNSEANRKVLIMGRGAITTTGNDITVKDGSGYTEETIDVSGDKPESRNVTTALGKTTVDIPPEKGFYILNLKTDTIVGSRQVFGKDISSGRTITQEELKAKIDSLVKLTTGTNVSANRSNFIILPNRVKKISDNIDIKVFGPFTKIPGSLDVDKNGKAPEIYKFYTNNEMRELIANLKKMTF